mgnify:CR=1 FL=1
MFWLRSFVVVVVVVVVVVIGKQVKELKEKTQNSLKSLHGNKQTGKGIEQNHPGSNTLAGLMHRGLWNIPSSWVQMEAERTLSHLFYCLCTASFVALKPH